MERPGLNTFLNSFSTTLEAPVKQHIKNVYACLSMSTLAAGLGASIHLFTNIQAGFLSAIGALVFLFLLMSTPDDNGKGMTKRVGYLLGFSTLTGVGLGPILETAILINPSVIITAFIGTSVIFFVADEPGQHIFGSTLLFNAQVYLGLIAMCGFVLYDTQAIIEKRRQGNKDFVAHSLDLFIDFLGIFKRLLIILMQKEEESNKKRRR